MTLQLDVFAEGPGFPEGPVIQNDGTVIFVDIFKQTLCKTTGNGDVDIIADPPGGPNGTAIGPDGAVYICNNGGIYLYGYPDGRRDD